MRVFNTPVYSFVLLLLLRKEASKQAALRISGCVGMVDIIPLDRIDRKIVQVQVLSPTKYFVD